MNPKNNDRPESKKIVLENRGMLANKNSLKSDDSGKPADGLDIDGKEKPEPLADHKLRVEPIKNAVIESAAKPNAEPAKKSPAEPAKQSSENPAESDELKKPVVHAPPKPDPEEAAKAEAVDKLIEEKKYFVPITHKKQNRSKRQFVLTFILVLLVGLFAINLAIDAGVIKTNVKPVINLINN